MKKNLWLIIKKYEEEHAYDKKEKRITTANSYTSSHRKISKYLSIVA